MEKKSDIIIIGAGLIGLSTADQLSARGLSVTVIDAAVGPGRGASFSNSGMIHPSQALPWLVENPEPTVVNAVHGLAERSRDLLFNQFDRLKISDARRPDGCLQLFDSQYFGQQAMARYDEMGVAVKPYRGPWDTARYALFFPNDRSGNAFEYCEVLERDLRSRGVRFVYEALARLIQRNDRVEVNVGDTLYIGQHIVVACGAASEHLIHPLGLALPVKAVTGHAMNFARPDMELPPWPIMHYETRSAITAFKDHLRLSGTVGEGEPEALAEIWEEILPDLYAVLGKPISVWSGDRPASALGRPIIGETPINGLWVNCGHGHMGWTLSAGSGELMARLIVDNVKASEFEFPA